MEFQNIRFQKKENIGILTVDRPKALNALNTQTIQEMCSVFKEVKMDDTLRLLIITGAGEKAFIAGADIGEIQELTLKNGLEFLQAGHQMNRDIEGLGKPTIAAINGLALGGGCELALACSLRIISEKAKMGLPELGLGVIPGYGGTQRLARLIGKGRALWYLLTGDMIDAPTALELGLANMVAAPEELMEKTLKLGKKIASKGPFAVKMALMAVNYGLETNMESGLALEAALTNLALQSKDKEEGIAAFFEKRKPNYTGE
ncbi:MAG: enoyl-CoA hydratase/isomerase family protein [Deltaproteobacteria bacterium]|nr:enoyl-CoA hydratase/isomerase family protein [Deltaproteobacteria bacterium]